MPPTQQIRYRFGEFLLEARSGELRRNGTVLRLQPQSLQVLLTLIERRGEIVTREELRGSLWPEDTFVEFDDGLNHAIRRVRSLLGDTAQVPRFIETIPRRGYRFIGEVQPELPESFALGQSQDISATKVRYLILPAALLVLVAASVAGFSFYRYRHQASEIRSLAVLPLANFSGDPDQEYFADGLTEELTTELSRVKSVRVISRTSAMRLKGTKKSLSDIGRELEVDGVIEGSVQRSGNRIRIVAQLVRVVNERHLWAEAYEREWKDFLLIRDELAREIASKVRAKIAPQETQGSVAQSTTPEAYDAFLVAMRLFDQGTVEGYKKSIPYFEEAIRNDPKYALAYAELSEAYSMMAFQLGLRGYYYKEAQAAARKAVELDPTLPEANIREADLHFYSDWDWSQCDGAFRLAALQAPQSADVQFHYGVCLEVLGRYSDALHYIENARKVDPLSPFLNLNLGRLLARLRKFPEAIEFLEKARDLDANSAGAYEFLALVYREQNQSSKYVEARIAADRVRSESTENLTALENAYLTGGIASFEAKRKEFFRVRLQKLLRHDGGDVSPLTIAAMYTTLGDRDNAIHWLEKAYEQRIPMLVWLKSSAVWIPLHDDPRYHALLKRMGLPD